MQSEEQVHCSELLEVLEENILTLSRLSEEENTTAIHKLFQAAHNLKSGLAMANLQNASKVFHILEDGLDSVRRGKTLLTTATADFILQVIDETRTTLEKGDDSEIHPELYVIPSGKKTGKDSSSGCSNSTQARSAPDTIQNALATGQNVYRIDKLFSPGISRHDFESHMILDDIGSVGTILLVAPDYDTYSSATAETVVKFWFSSSQTAAELEQLFWDPLIPVQGKQPAHPEPAAAAVQNSFSGTIKSLVVEDDFTSRFLLQEILKDFGPVYVAVNGKEAVLAVQQAFASNEPYALICLDIMMPEMDGQTALQQIRKCEEDRGILSTDGATIIMTTALGAIKNVSNAYSALCDGYLVKPICKKNLTDELRKQDLIP